MKNMKGVGSRALLDSHPKTNHRAGLRLLSLKSWLHPVTPIWIWIFRRDKGVVRLLVCFFWVPFGFLLVQRLASFALFFHGSPYGSRFFLPMCVCVCVRVLAPCLPLSLDDDGPFASWTVITLDICLPACMHPKTRSSPFFPPLLFLLLVRSVCFAFCRMRTQAPLPHFLRHDLVKEAVREQLLDAEGQPRRDGQEVGGRVARLGPLVRERPVYDVGDLLRRACTAHAPLEDAEVGVEAGVRLGCGRGVAHLLRIEDLIEVTVKPLKKALIYVTITFTNACVTTTTDTHLGQDGRGDEARLDQRDGDLVREQLLAQGIAEALQRGLGASIDPLLRLRDAPGQAAGEHDPCLCRCLCALDIGKKEPFGDLQRGFICFQVVNEDDHTNLTRPTAPCPRG